MVWFQLDKYEKKRKCCHLTTTIHPFQNNFKFQNKALSFLMRVVVVVVFQYHHHRSLDIVVVFHIHAWKRWILKVKFTMLHCLHPVHLSFSIHLILIFFSFFFFIFKLQKISFLCSLSKNIHEFIVLNLKSQSRTESSRP